MRVMMDFAAGLFIWADMVINYIAQPAADDPLARLQIVLDDMKTQSGIEQCDQVDILYARIIFEAFQKSTRRNKAKSILAIVLLAKEPLRKSDVIELLSTAEWDSSIMTQITLGLLSPIINDKLRVRHKTVSDFLLSHERSSTAMKRFVKEDGELPSYLIDAKEDHRGFASTCMHLVCRIFANPKDIDRVVDFSMQSSGPFYYARQYWFGHLEGAGVDWEPTLPHFQSLADAMEVAYGCLERYANEPKLTKEEAVALITCLRDTADFVIRRINQGNFSHWSREMVG